MEGILIMSKKEVDRLTKDHPFRKMNQKHKEEIRGGIFLPAELRKLQSGYALLPLL